MHSKKQIELSGCTANCDDEGRYALHDGLFWLYVNSWGRAKEDLKNRSERSTAHSCLLGERGAMKDPVSEVIEVANAK